MKGAPQFYPNESRVETVWHRYGDWDVTVLEVVRYQADAVIVMAGRKGVVQAGIAGVDAGASHGSLGGFEGEPRSFGSMAARIVSDSILAL